LRNGLLLDQKLQSTTWIPLRLYLLARLELARGNLRDARVYGWRLVAASRQSTVAEDLERAGVVELQLGDVSNARACLRQLNSLRSQKGQNFTESFFSNLQGEVQAASGRTDEAIESQLRASAFLHLVGGPHASLGKLYGMKGDWPNAIKEYQQYLQLKGEILDDDFSGGWVLAHLWLARAFRNAGDVPHALESYNQFLQLWASADPGLPDLLEARAEKQQLESNPRNAVSAVR